VVSSSGGPPLLGGGVHDVEPDRARLDPGHPGLRVDPDAAHPPGPQQQRVRQRPERPGVVTGALGGDPQATLGRPADGGRHVGRRLREHHGGRPLVDGEVPGPPGLIEATVAREHHCAHQARVQGTGLQGRC